MHHGNRCSCRGCDHVDLPVHTQLMVGNQHRKIRCAGRDIARSLPDGIGRRHTRPGIAFTGGKGHTGLQISCGIQKCSTLRCQRACTCSGYQNLRQDISELPRHPFGRSQRVKLLHHSLVVIIGDAVDREHTGGFSDAHSALTCQQVMDIARKCGQMGNIFHMGLSVQNGLIQVGNAPPLRDIKAQQFRQFRSSRTGDGVAPGTKLCQLLAVFIKRQITVHHARNADCAESVRCRTEFFLHITPQVSIAIF